MKVKDLLEKLANVDPELDVGISYADHEYWGVLYQVAERADVRREQVDGPKRPDRLVFLIQ